MAMVTNLSAANSIVSVWMHEIRDAAKQTDRMRFRRNMERIGEVAAYEISKHLPYLCVDVTTPLANTTCQVLEREPVIATIFRAGLPLYQGVLNFFDHADSAFIGSYRKHAKDGTFEVAQQYMASPALAGRPLIIADPMLATGASMVQAITSLMEYDQPTQLHIVAVIASTEGIATVEQRFPDAYIWVGAIDNELTNRKYILPGLGDAGDLAFGEKRQF
jgi:uracil phosphoribosyltransferase